MNRLAVLGRPIAHSLSPKMHRAAFAAVGIEGDWSYEAIELAPADFEVRVRQMAAEPEWRGANVTIPHKEAALAVADRATDTAREIGAANTLSFEDGRIEAANTDAPGLIAALADVAIAGRTALVLGAGGAGRAAAWALREAGARVLTWNRTLERSSRLAMELGIEIQPPEAKIGPESFDLLVNATSAGLESAANPGETPQVGVESGKSPSTEGGQELILLPVLADALGERHVVVDLVYGVEETELTRIGRENGSQVIDGIEVLVRQGAESFRIWTGVDPPVESMRNALTG